MAGEIFISYRRTDEVWARLLHGLLRAEGVEAWYDAHIAPGEDWRIATAKALEDSRIFVLLFSSNAAQSSDIAKELAAATLEKKLIIPVRLENISPKGAFLYELASRNWVNAFENTEEKLAELAKGLAHLVKTGARDESVLPFDRSSAGASPTSKGRRSPLLIAAAAVTTLAAFVTAWSLWPATHMMVESSRPFISTLALEGEPAFSPDGKMLAYSSGKDTLSRKIYVRNLAGGDGTKITSDAHDDVSPSWSPDGTRIAYIAKKAGEPCRIMVATIPAGEIRQVGRCRQEELTSVSWRPGTAFLYYHDFAERLKGIAVFRLDIDNGTLMQVTNKLGAIRHLQCSPDGKSLLYMWGQTASTEAIVIIDLGSGKERTLGKIIGRGSATWSEDSRAVLASTASGIGSEITAYPLSGDTPYHVYAATISISHLAAGGGSLAVETDSSRENLSRALAAPATQPDIVEAVNGRTWSPTFAPDGTLAFLSNRSGTNAIWTMKPGTASVMLYDAGLAPLFRIQYSPDGTKLAAAIARADGITMKILTAGGGTMVSFDSPTLGYGHPTWTPDSKEVVLFDRQVLHVVRIAVDNPASRMPIAPAPPWGTVTMRNDGIFIAKFGKDGVWQFGKEPRLISAKYPANFEPPITFKGDDLLVPDFNAPDGPRILAQPVTGGPDRVLAYAPGAQAQDGGLMSKMVANPRTGEIIYVAAVQGDTNIDLLTLARH